MHHKDIKREIKKQLKKQFPNWKRLSKKEKREIANAVLKEVVDNHDFKEEVTAPEHELLGIEEQVFSPRIMDLNRMAKFIESHNSGQIIKIKEFSDKSGHVKDEELKLIDELPDNGIINKILSYEGYSPSMREFAPSLFLRAELLKALKYPEISYRKFCGDDRNDEKHKLCNSYTGADQKQNRAFIGPDLRRTTQMLSHVQLSQFRSDLTFPQMVNLTVYILHQFNQCGFSDEKTIHCIDSTELAIECQTLLATLKIKGKKIRIYDDIDCDCGTRRKKRDKSVYVVGYRLHTLSAINAKTGQSYPQISLLAPANHHDSNFLVPLSRLAQAIGSDVKLITADEAYEDKEGGLREETGINLVRPANSKVLLPSNVDDETMNVTPDDLCEIPMDYLGAGDNCHEFRCAAGSGECVREVLAQGSGK